MIMFACFSPLGTHYWPSAGLPYQKFGHHSLNCVYFSMTTGMKNTSTWSRASSKNMHVHDGRFLCSFASANGIVASCNFSFKYHLFIRYPLCAHDH